MIYLNTYQEKKSHEIITLDEKLACYRLGCRGIEGHMKSHDEG